MNPPAFKPVLRYIAGSICLAIWLGCDVPASGDAQGGSGRVAETEAQLAEELQEAADADSPYDRLRKYMAFRVPESMIEIAPANQHADLIVWNRYVATLRASVLENPPMARARRAAEALGELAGKNRVSPVEAFPVEQGVLFVVAERPVFAITHQDLDLIAGEILEERTAEIQANLERALAEMVELRDPEKLVGGLLRALAALLLLALAFWVLQRLRKSIHERLLPALDGRLRESLSRRMGESAREELRFLSALRRLTKLLLGIALLALAYTWLAYSLEQFPYTRPWGESLGETLVDLLIWVAEGVARAIPGLFVVLLVFLLARLASRLVRGLFSAVERGRLSLPGIHPETAQPTRRIVNALVWLVAIVVAYPYFPGSSTAAFKGLSVFVGVVVSLGSTGIVNQAMSGLMLMYARALKPGDFVKIGGVEGTVTDLGMLSTKVRSLQNEEVTVPNAVVISGETVNYSRFESVGVAIRTSLTIGYDTPWRTVHDLLEAAVRETPGLRAGTEPTVLQTALSDHYPEYELRVVIDRPEDRPRVLSALHQNIQDAFHRSGIQIMSPHYVADPPEPLIGSAEERAERS